MEDRVMTESFFDPSRHKWREVTGEPDSSYLIHHDYTILGHDVAAGTLDMIVRWGEDGGHCPLHRHVSTTTILVLAGEQQLWDIHPDGSRGEHKVRSAGDYALTLGDGLPHLERGGEKGGMAFFGSHCTSGGALYELLDEEMKVIADVTIETLVSDWQDNT